MSSPRPFEASLLDRAAKALDDSAQKSPNEPQLARNLVLAHVASEFSGLDRSRVRIDWFPEFRLSKQLGGVPSQIANAIQDSGIPPALAIASLAQPLIPESERRKNGAYYTDFRLANYVSSMLPLKRRQLVLDAACGTGILLAAAVLRLARGSMTTASEVIAECVCGADLSVQALKGTLLSLAAMTGDHVAISSVARRLRVQDSLLAGYDAWRECAPSGFNIVIGNPPWEKLKVTRHEWLRGRGFDRHYGQDYDGAISGTLFTSAQHDRYAYARQLEQEYSAHGGGEQDLFKFFLELALRVCKPDGRIVLLLPAGLIRSQGTTELRRFAFDSCSDVELTVLDNRVRFFSIDTRFKFLTFHGRKAGHANSSTGEIRLVTAKASERKVEAHGVFAIARHSLERVRTDLSVPEVKNEREWKIFRDLTRRGVRLGDPSGPWQPHLMREVDMTRDRHHFCAPTCADGTIPLIEGRMVHQFRLPAKRYVSGTGRRARWEAVSERDDQLAPQFRFPRERLTTAVQERISERRAGFCDITGQTNERTMLASRIPAGVVCGNKVPTIVFGGKDPLLFVDCWLAIANSIVFDWLLRRVVTTTVNYFLLLDLPFPRIIPESPQGRQLARLVRRLVEDRSLTKWEQAEVRAEIDWRVLAAFGHDAATLQVLLNDFPLLDRTQPVLPRDERSTITIDLVLLRAAENTSGVRHTRIEQLRERVFRAREVGATPYVPSYLHDDTAAEAS